MANKEKLQNLVDDLIGTNEQQNQDKATAEATAPPQTPPQTPRKIGKITRNKVEEYEALRKANVGRPKGRRNGNPKPLEARATFVVSRAITRKVKYISLVDTRLYKDVIAEALNSYIEEWESRNGKITI